MAQHDLGAADAQYRRVKDADDVDIWYGRAALRLQPSDAFGVTFSFTHQSDDIGGRRQVTRGLDGFGREYGRYENGSIQLEPSSRDVDLGAIEATIDLGFATLTSSSSYYDHNGDSTSENTGFYAQAGFLGFYYNYPRPMASAVRTYGDKAFVQELRLASKGENTFDYVVGAFYEDQKLKGTQDSFLRGFKTWWDNVYCGSFPACVAAVTGDRDFAYDRREKYKDKAAVRRTDLARNRRVGAHRRRALVRLQLQEQYVHGPAALREPVGPDHRAVQVFRQQGALQGQRVVAVRRARHAVRHGFGRLSSRRLERRADHGQLRRKPAVAGV